MGAESVSKGIRRIAVIVETADGERVMFYAQDQERASVTVTWETPAYPDVWGDGSRRRPTGPPRTEIKVEGLEAHYMLGFESLEAVVGGHLDAAQATVEGLKP